MKLSKKDFRGIEKEIDLIDLAELRLYMKVDVSSGRVTYWVQKKAPSHSCSISIEFNTLDDALSYLKNQKNNKVKLWKDC